MKIRQVAYIDISKDNADKLLNTFRELSLMENKIKKLKEISVYPEIGGAISISRWLIDNNMIDEGCQRLFRFNKIHKIVFSIKG